MTVDEAFGRATTFLDGVAQLDLWYLAEVPVDTEVWRQRPQTEVPAGSGQGRPPTRVRLKAGEPAPQRVDVLADAIPADEWCPYLIEVRTWLGWHHHMTLCLLAHHFLVRTQQRLKKRACVDLLAGSDADSFRFASQTADACRSLAADPFYSAAKSCGLSVAS